MIIPAAGIRAALTRSFLHLMILLFLLLPPGFAAFAQGTTVSTTPPGIAPGAPAGSYPLSGFENVNLYNGNLNFHLPLAVIGGRGKAGYTMTLTIDNKRWIVHTDDVFQSHWADFYWWTGYKPGLGAGAMNVRTVSTDLMDCSPYSLPNWYSRSLSRLSFTAPDGTEYEFRDALTNGSQNVISCGGLDTARRGKVWVSSEGSATGICDQEIYDNPWEPGGENGQVLTTGGGILVNISGYLLMRDGTRYRIDNTFVSSIRDANGNNFTISSGTTTVVTDSLNRTVTAGADVNGNAVITFKGVGGATRQIKIWYRSLSYALSNPSDPDRVLRADFTGPLKTTLELFPSLNGSPTTPFDPRLVSAVELPDGRRYQFRYNYYGELAKVILRTGGSYEYDWEAGPGADSSGVVRYTDTKFRSHIGIYRRVKERRVYSSGTTLESKTIFTPSHPSYFYDPRPWTTTVMAVNKDANGAFLSGSKHYFTGSPSASMVTFPYDYSEWDDGREYQTQMLADDSPSPTVLRQSSMTWQNGPGGPSYVNWHYYNDRRPPVSNPRVVETVTTLIDVSPNLVSKQTSIDPISGAVGFDQYNNPTDVWEYDYGQEAPGALLRHTQNSYLTSGYDTVAGTPINPNLAATIHIRSLPTSQAVYSDPGTSNKVAETTYEYDNYTPDAHHASLGAVARPNISGLDPAFTTSYTTRGNATAVSRWLNTTGSYVTNWQQYDVAGSVVKTIDALNNAMTFDFSDRFGSPGDDAEQNTPPAELNGQTAYAFATKVTNALGHTAYTKYDYYLGKPVNIEDANGIVSSVAYNDALDRPTQGIQARYKVTTPPCAPPPVCVPAERRQTTITYDDANHVITTSSDRDAFGDNKLTAKSYYDGLGRTWRGAAYEGATWSIKDTQFDALGRVSQISNPYRAADPGSASPPAGLWTTSEYDALGRVIKVTTPDSAHVDTAYSGNQVTVTDQAGKKRSSQTDALGRLVKVTEDPGTGKLNYDTTYLYDALGNLRKVTQGAQTRWFAYDSLSRLIRSKNPEQNTNGSLPAYTDPVTSNSGWAMAYSYDANGNLTQRIDARGIVTNYFYDGLNRNWGIDCINGSQISYVVRVFDGAVNGKGRLYWDRTMEGGTQDLGTAVTANAIDSYDALGRPLTKRQHFWQGSGWSPAYAVQHAYDLAGNVKTQTYPSGRTVKYSHDQAGRLSSLSGNLGGSPYIYADTISYNAAGQMIKERFGANTSLYHRSHYNNRLQLVSTRLGDSATDEWSWNRGAIGFYYGSTAVASGDIFANDTDNNGNLLRQTNFVPLAGGGYVIPQRDDYTYDALNRVSSFTEAQMNSGGQWTLNVASQNFSYDRFGNRQITSATGGVNNYNPTYDTTNNNNRIVGLGYDAAGNITSDPMTGGLMTYDPENRMLTATNGGLSGSYTYDADGRRVKRITGGVETWQIYGIGGELLAEYAAGASPSTPQKEYGYRGGQLLVIAEPGSGGNLAWGKATSQSSTSFGGESSRGVDGNTSGNWGDNSVSHTNFEHQPWWQVDLGSVQQIGTVRLWNRTDCCSERLSNFYVLVSDNPFSSTDLTTTINQAGVSSYYTAGPAGLLTEIGVGRSGRYVRVQLAGDNYLSLAEVEVMGGTVSGEGVKWLVQDHLGSTRMVVDRSGSLGGVRRHDFLPFGEELSAGIGIRSASNGYSGDSVRQKFGSKEHDIETGFDYFIARYYSSVQGRFTSVDPGNAGAEMEYPQAWNGYSYAINNPLTYSDPDGLKVKVCDSNGNCTEISDADATKYLFNNKYQQQSGYRLDGKGGVFDTGGNKIGTYQRTSSDDLSAEANAFIFGRGGMIDQSRRAKPIVEAVGAVAALVVATPYIGLQTATLVGADLYDNGGKPSVNTAIVLASGIVPPLKSLHGPEVYESGLAKGSLEYWRKQPTEKIIESLKPGQTEPLITKPDGTIMQGNNRVKVLRERGVDVNSLPRTPK